jgi:hypothetical protein
MNREKEIHRRRLVKCKEILIQDLKKIKDEKAYSNATLEDIIKSNNYFFVAEDKYGLYYIRELIEIAYNKCDNKEKVEKEMDSFIEEEMKKFNNSLESSTAKAFFKLEHLEIIIQHLTEVNYGKLTIFKLTFAFIPPIPNLR